MEGVRLFHILKKTLGIILILAGQVLPGQESVAFRHINQRDGLSQNSVFAIAQDGSGFMWFGTRDGLNRYDGYRIIVYRHSENDPHSIISDDIRALYYDAYSQSLWACTAEGLSQYREATDDFLNYPAADGVAGALSGTAVRCVFRDSRHRLWVGTDGGLNRYVPEEDAFFSLPRKGKNAGGLSSYDVKALFEGQRNQLWVGTEDGLHLLVEEGQGTYSFEQVLNGAGGSLELPGQHIKAIVEDEGGNLWIGMHNSGVSYWDRQKGRLFNFQNEAGNLFSLSHNNVRSIALGPDGSLWVGTFVGLNKFLPEQNRFQRFLNEEADSYSLSSSSVRSVFFDKRGSLWVGTYYGGVEFLDKESNRFRNYQRQPRGNCISHNVVSSFLEDEKGNLWIGTEGGGLNYFNRRTNRFSHYMAEKGLVNSISGNNVKTLLKDGDKLWIGTFAQGLDLLDVRTSVFQNFRHDPGAANSLSDNNVYSLLKEEGVLWIATYGGGLNRLDLKSMTFEATRHGPTDSLSLCSNLTRVIFRDSRGHIWIGTEGGLDKVLAREGPELRFGHYLSEIAIYSMYESKDGTLWAGSYSNGLFTLDDNGEVLANYTEADGLPGHTIFGILEDDAGQIWLSTNNGLVKFDRRNQYFTDYNYSDGLRNLEYNFNAYNKTSKGEFLFGGTNGFTLFRPGEIKINTFVPPVVFTELESFNRPVKVNDGHGLLSKAINLTRSLTFKYNQANFSLSFAALDYFNPDNNRYAYMLEGLDIDWKYTQGKTEANYTIQRPGDYTFRLKGANSDGIWNSKERQLHIVVLPPPWRSWWAYLIYSLFIALAIFSVLRFIRLRHRLQLEQIEKEKQEELHQSKLRFFTNIAHEFRTPLTLILGPLEELTQKQEASGPVHRQLLSIQNNAQRLLNLVNQLLTFRKLEADHEQMQAAEGNVVRFVNEIFLSFQENARLRKIEYTFSSSRGRIIVWYDRDKLEKVVYNLLSNAFKFTPDGGAITVNITLDEGSAYIQVRDTGKGIPIELQEQVFKRFYEKEAVFRHSFKGTGIGLAVSRQLVEMHHGRITVRSEPGVGAAFEVKIPLGRKHLREEEIIQDFRDSEDITNYEPERASSLLNTYESGYLPLPEVPVSEAPADAPLLLIIEDNPEVQHYIQHIFQGIYRIITANDGKEGLARAIKEAPDLIISDVMMPKMDGITLCSQLKTHVHTSHIPVMLLTARTGLIFKIEGLETGADDYVTKPFSPEELRLRARNILQARQKMREKFSRLLNLEPKAVTITSADEEFLERAIQLVEQQMNNSDFSVGQFAYEMAVSRPLLFIKIKAITNFTPNNFIKNIRLKRAAQLLQQKKIGVAEVAYQVGFKDPRYFSKCFQKQFQKTPTEYMAE